MKRDVRPLVEGAHRRRELLPAVVAVIPARPQRLAAEGAYPVKAAAERAASPVRPTDRLKVLPGGFFVGENRVREVGGHVLVS